MKDILQAEMGDREDTRIAIALGINPHETAANSLSIEPVGAAFAVRWQGVKIVSRDELLRAIDPAHANCSRGETE